MDFTFGQWSDQSCFGLFRVDRSPKPIVHFVEAAYRV